GFIPAVLPTTRLDPPFFSGLPSRRAAGRTRRPRPRGPGFARPGRPHRDRHGGMERMRRLATLTAVAALLASSTPASAGLLPVRVSVTPEGHKFLWPYA